MVYLKLISPAPSNGTELLTLGENVLTGSPRLSGQRPELFGLLLNKQSAVNPSVSLWLSPGSDSGCLMGILRIMVSHKFQLMALLTFGVAMLFIENQIQKLEDSRARLGKTRVL